MRSENLRTDTPGMLTIMGELDMMTAGVVRAELTARPRILATDCSGVTFIDSAGLDAIVQPPDGRLILLVNPSPVVAHLLDLFDGIDLWRSPARVLVSAR